MSKLLVKLHEGSLLDLLGGNQYVISYRPMVVESTSLIQATIARGKMDLLGKLKDNADDKDFIKCREKFKGDPEKALAEYLKIWDVKKKAPVNEQGNPPAGNVPAGAGNAGTKSNNQNN